MEHTTVRKAVIAAAGFGTRFLPQTKAMPKEMLPLVDKPIIQYIVEELVDAGIQDIVIVTGYHKRSIEDHFDQMSADLRANLKQGDKLELLEETKKISDLANFAYIRQKGPYGNGTPMLNAEHLIGNEPFIYTFADDFIVAEPSRFKQMIDVYQRTGSSVLTCIRVENDEDYDRYGIIDGEQIEDDLVRMNTIIEKPGKQNAPSNLASVSGYVFTPEIFKYLHMAQDNLQPGHEFYQQAAMQLMIDNGNEMLAYEVKNSRYYDTGNKLEYLKTVVDFALKHDDIKDEFAAYLRTLVK
ncbi:UTP--glucose-1-phosphate uridylyltransferase [Candidatus Saccharibacteria bacterium]|nr:UTP--glucose-1-phosphate uridylyltransferase [Candidatus Saccharibacteria bacterium]